MSGAPFFGPTSSMIGGSAAVDRSARHDFGLCERALVAIRPLFYAVEAHPEHAAQYA